MAHSCTLQALYVILSDMDQKKTLFITGLAVILILAIIFGTIFYLVRAIRQRQSNSANQENLFPPAVISPTPLFPDATQQPSASNQPAAEETTQTSDLKTYNGDNVQLQYPKEWGLLTCSNSKNIEFDPTNSTDQQGVRCDRALKPITILVNQTAACQGEAAKIGNVNVTKSVTTTSTGTNYRWCTHTTPVLDITHRVSSAPSRATSAQDYAQQIEKMISTAHFGNPL